MLLLWLVSVVLVALAVLRECLCSASAIVGVRTGCSKQRSKVVCRSGTKE